MKRSLKTLCLALMLICVACGQPDQDVDDPVELPDAEVAAGEIAAGEIAAGEIAAGEPAAGDAVAGEVVAGGAVAGEAVAGEAVAGEAVAGEAVAGEAVAGEAVAGEAVAGEVVAGEPIAGEAVAGEPIAGEPIAGEAVAGDPTAGEVAGEALAGEMTAGEMTPSGNLNASELNGAWGGCRSETARSLYIRYEFTPLDDERGQWRYEEQRFGEERCLGAPSLTVIESGDFELGQPLNALVRARLITLSYEARSLTPNNQNTAELLSNTLCPDGDFTLNQSGDISSTGCERLGFESLSDCARRYDIISLLDDELSLGLTPDEPQTFCAEQGRPLTLGNAL